MADDVKDLYLQHRVGQDKYTYFLLAAAAAALAFALQKTEGMVLTWSMAPLALAAISWALSFYCGCKCITWVQTALHANIAFLQLKSGSHPEQPADAAGLNAAVSGVRMALDHNSEKVRFFANWQFRMLLVGAVLFIGWHVYEMYLRT